MALGLRRSRVCRERSRPQPQPGQAAGLADVLSQRLCTYFCTMLSSLKVYKQQRCQRSRQHRSSTVWRDPCLNIAVCAGTQASGMSRIV